MDSWPFLLVLLGTNAFTWASAMVLLRQRHTHDFSDWSGWMQDTVDALYGDVRARRYRTCEGCNVVEDQKAGLHRCLEVRNRKKCHHLEHLIGNETQRVKRLERELGFD
jgi:hypothetical protein